MSFFIRDCVRCGVRKINHRVVGDAWIAAPNIREVAGACADCKKVSIYTWIPTDKTVMAAQVSGNIEIDRIYRLSKEPVRIAVMSVELSNHIPDRISKLFMEANECRQMTYYEAAGAIFRKTIDVCTKHIYETDSRLNGKEPANALRARIKALSEMKIIDEDIADLADIAALDGNDAAHDVDPYTKEEAEALEDLTMDILERVFVRPAKAAAVREKQIAAGVRRGN